MKQLVFVLLLVSTMVKAQQTESDSTKVWSTKGNFSLIANQSTFNNWLAGGQNNISGSVNLNYDCNYKKNGWNWDNKFILAYGLTKIEESDLEKTDDRIEFNSLLGKKAKGNWFYSAFLNFKTQMDVGYVEAEMADGTKYSHRVSHFFSPAYLQVGPGMLWKKSDNLKVNIAPATSKIIVVHDHFTVDESSFGVEQGETMRYELGAALSGYYKFELLKNVTFENILNLYSNYLEEPQNVDLDYQLNVVLKVNNYLTTNFNFQTIYDDNAFRGFQTKQVIGLGLNMTF